VSANNYNPTQPLNNNYTNNNGINGNNLSANGIQSKELSGAVNILNNGQNKDAISSSMSCVQFSQASSPRMTSSVQQLPWGVGQRVYDITAVVPQTSFNSIPTKFWKQI
jgi:hypothetical protein